MIQDYSPVYIDTTSDLIEVVKTIICPFIGQELKESWIGWMDEDDCWWEDMPIILQIGNERLEICWNQFQDVSITKNQIPVDGSAHFTMEDASIKKNAHKVLNKFMGKTITAIEVGETTMSMGDSGLVWIPNSINFIFGEDFLSIYNGLDENQVSDERPSEAISRSYPICPM